MKIYEYYTRKLVAEIEKKDLNKWANENNALVHSVKKEKVLVFIK